MIELVTKDAIAKLRKEFSNLKDADINRAVSKAINRQLTPSRNLAIREICKTYNLEPEYLKQKTVMRLQHSRNNTLTGSILVSVRPIGLTAFNPEQTEDGVKIQIKRGEFQVIKNAFVKVMPNGGHGVFARGKYSGGKFAFRKNRIKSPGGYKTVNGRSQPKNNDLVINNLKTVSAYAGFIRPEILRLMDARIQKNFPRRLALELQKINGAGE